MIVAETNGSIVGCHHGVPMNLMVMGDIIPASMGADLAVTEAYRQLGVRRAMQVDYKRRGLEKGRIVNYYISGNPIMIQTGLKNDKVFPFKIENMVRIIDIDLHLKMMPTDSNFIAATGYRGAKFLNELSLKIRAPIKRGTFKIVDVVSFGDEVEAFWGEVSKAYDFIIERRSAFLNWKYFDPRVGRFKVRKAIDASGKLLGYCVSRVNKYLLEYPLGYIVDLLALPGRLDVIDALVGDAVADFDRQNVNLINYQAVKDHPYTDVLARHGFLDSRIEILLFYWLYYGQDPIRDISNSKAEKLFISWGDHDVLPIKGSR